MTNCAAGTLQFAPEVTVGGACSAVGATRASGTVKHAKNRVACPPSPPPPPSTVTSDIPVEGTSIAVYTCPPDTQLCTSSVEFEAEATTLNACAPACEGQMLFCAGCSAGLQCGCAGFPDGYVLNVPNLEYEPYFISFPGTQGPLPETCAP